MEKFQRPDHIPVPARCQHLLTDVASSCWIKGPFVWEIPCTSGHRQTLPALDQAFIKLAVAGAVGRTKSCFGSQNVLFLNLRWPHTDRACLHKHVFAHLSPPLICFLTLSDAAWHPCSLLLSMVNSSTTPASWKTCWWTWLMPQLLRTPNLCCAVQSLLWRRCSPTGCPYACTATSRWGWEEE